MKYPKHEWISGDIPEWASTSDKRYDIVFSGAALQWVGIISSCFPD
jgi:trans-aconitate methyltransferase